MSKDRKLVSPSINMKTMIPESLVLKGGVIEGREGMLIDGKLAKAKIVSTDDSLIHISAMAKLEECIIEGCDVLLEGDCSGIFHVKGNCEIGASATAVGELLVTGDTFISRFADVKDLKVTSVKPSMATDDEDNQVDFQGVAAAA